MKKIFTLITTMLLALGTQAADDMTLNVSETVGFGDWGFSNEAAPTIKLSNWSSGGGWVFATPLSQSDYCGVDFKLEATTEKHVTFKIVYVGGKEQNIDVPMGSTSVNADFSFDDNVEKIGFAYGDWEGGPDEATITIVKAVVKAVSTGEVTALDFSALNDETKDEANQSITIARYSAYPNWSFDPAFNSDDYEKVVIHFAEPIANDGLEIKAESEEDGWCGTTIGNLVKGATKATGYFSKKPGVKIKSVGFYYSWSTDAGDTATLKIANAELVKKSDATGITPITTTNTQDNDTIVYSLSGQRVKNATKGIYIIGGKKVVVK